MNPRITISLNKDDELEIWLNKAGRDILVRELEGLSEKSDHFHLSTEEGSEVPLSDVTYRVEDRAIEWAKVIYRTDEWDKEYFPHVMTNHS